MSVTSIVTHLAWVEWHWFERSFEGSTARDPDPRCGWDQDLTLHAALELYDVQCARSRDIVAANSMDDLEQYAPPGLPIVSLRWIVSHVLEETARHVGHLDLLRESIDGERGY